MEYRSIINNYNDLPSVLVVEDDSAIAEEIVDALKLRKFEVIGPATTVAEAISSIHGRVPDLAILDLRLATETSVPIARYLEKRGVPFIFLTGSPDEVRAEFPSAPTLAKPTRLASLFTTLESITLKRAA